MQSVLKLMPDPIPEVPRDDAGHKSSGLMEKGGSEFGGLYEQQLNQNNKPVDNQRLDQSGNDSQVKRQPLDSETSHQKSPDKVTADKATDAETKATNAGTVTDSTNAKAVNETKAVGDKVNTTEQKVLVASGEQNPKSEEQKAAKSFDQLLDVMSKADKMLRQTNGVVPNEPQAEGELVLRQNKLTAAIDEALIKQDENALPAKVMMQKLAVESGGDGKAQAENNGIELSSPGEVKPNDGKALTLDDLETAGINPKLQIDMEQQAGLKGGLKDEGQVSNPFLQTAGIKPAKPSKDEQPQINIGQPNEQTGKGKPYNAPFTASVK